MIRVYGDIMLDRWIIGKAKRISPEAPVPVLKESEQKFCPGGAANLALNIASLNGNIAIYGTIAPDREGYRVIDCFKPYNKIDFRATLDSKVTTTKNRLVGQGGQHIVRWDREEHYTGTEAFNRLINDQVTNDLVCISDYNKGTIKKDTVPTLVKRGCKVLVDPKQDPEYYKGAFLVKPNMKEYKQWFGDFRKETALLKMKKYNWTWLVVTDGKNGLTVMNEDGRIKHYQEPVKEVADVTGAGDTVLAVLAYYIHQDIDVFDAAAKACFAAARSVEYRGVHVVTHEDLTKGVVFTNGVFDILHKGHLQLLKEARSLGNKLVVGVNTDASVQRLKGSDRPINDVQTRVAQLEMLPWVDEVVTFTDDTPYELIKTIQPDLIVKGGDYTVEQVVGHDIAPVHIVPTVDGYSTTKLIGEINGS
jgi:D-beta-D-heptose 7-phosphate kinase/D-beta-D-heptose 1-phosphate adenosyltransferase